MSLQFIMDSQKKFQKHMGYDLDAMTLQEKAKYIKEHMLWATDELHEMLHELPFAKDWSSKYYKWSPEKLQTQLTLAKEEYIDFLHFAINVGLALGLDENTIVQMYKEKNKINYERQENGY
jgi:dimeric dUTPase (all-alpha-NTP-PPase superfamily)